MSTGQGDGRISARRRDTNVLWVVWPIRDFFSSPSDPTCVPPSHPSADPLPPTTFPPNPLQTDHAERPAPALGRRSQEASITLSGSPLCLHHTKPTHAPPSSTSLSQERTPSLKLLQEPRHVEPSGPDRRPTHPLDRRRTRAQDRGGQPGQGSAGSRRTWSVFLPPPFSLLSS